MQEHYSETFNPIRPRAESVIRRIDRKMAYGFASVLGMLFIMFGLNIASIELTKDIRASRGGFLTGVHDPVPLATHQAVREVEFDDIIATPVERGDIDGMDMLTLTTPMGHQGFRILEWTVTDFDTFSIKTAGNHSLDFNGTALTWDDAVISEIEEDATRQLTGWRERLARKVKKKLDSPLCNTEALIDKVGHRHLSLVTAPACHVGVSAAKIYMHYTA